MKYGLTKATVDKIKGTFARFPAIEKAVLYGSRAKGNFKTGSDIDLTLYGESLTSDLREKIAEALDDLLLPYTIDLSIFDELNNAKLREHIERVGVVFYERSAQDANMKSGWEMKKLGEVFEIERGGSPRPIENFITNDANGINWIKIGDTKGVTKYIYKTKEKIRPEGARRSRIVNEGDFILSNSMSFGRPYIMKTTGCIHDGWLVFREKMPDIDKDFFYHLLGSDLVYSQFDSLAAGSTVRNLNIDLVKKVTIPLPLLPEQKRIVAILDEVFEGIATAKANAEKNLQNARELFDSYLQSVFANPGDGWEMKKLGEVCDFKSGTTIPDKYEDTSGEILYVKVGDMNLNGNEICINSSSRFVNIKNIRSNQIIPQGSVIFPKRGGAIFTNKKRKIIKPTIVDLNIMALVPSKSIDSNLLYYWFLRIDLTSLNNGSSIPQINNYSFDNIYISFPESLIDQKRIVAKLDALSAETKKLEAIYQQKLSALEELKKSVLQKAFTGGLS